MINLSHWTREGTFKIEPVVLGGSWHYRLWFKKDDLSIDLGVYSFPFTATGRWSVLTISGLN